MRVLDGRTTHRKCRKSCPMPLREDVVQLEIPFDGEMTKYRVEFNPKSVFGGNFSFWNNFLMRGNVLTRGSFTQTNEKTGKQRNVRQESLHGKLSIPSSMEAVARQGQDQRDGTARGIADRMRDGKLSKFFPCTFCHREFCSPVFLEKRECSSFGRQPSSRKPMLWLLHLEEAQRQSGRQAEAVSVVDH